MPTERVENIVILSLRSPRRLLLAARIRADEKRAACALNPHATVMTDPAFTGPPFFDPHDLVQVKNEMRLWPSMTGIDRAPIASYGDTERSVGEQEPTRLAAPTSHEVGGSSWPTRSAR